MIDTGCPSSPESVWEIDVLSLEPSEEEDLFPLGQEPALEEREQQSPLLQEITTRVATALNIDLPSDQEPTLMMRLAVGLHGFSFPSFLTFRRW